MIKNTATVRAFNACIELENTDDAQSPMARPVSATSIRSIARQRWQTNPIYGFSIETIKATKPNTVVYRVKSEVYE